MRQGVVTATIPLSGTVSDTIDLRGGRIQAIAAPSITSADLLVQGCFDTTSASFVRLRQPVFANPQSGDLRLATGPGSCMLLWPSNLPSPNYVRLESGVAQAAAAAFSIRFGSNG